MQFLEAKREFEIRYYYWATSEFEREIDLGLATLRSFKTGAASEFCKFMDELTGEERLLLARGRLKQFHSEAVKFLGEANLDEELEMCEKLQSFQSDLFVQGRAKALPKRSELEGKYATKTKLRRAILEAFIAAFGDQCLDLASVGSDPAFDFKMNCCGWKLRTRFEFDGKERQVWYYHQIYCDAVSRFQPTSNTNFLSKSISLNSWLGIYAQTEWGQILDAEITNTCETMVQICSKFIIVAPKLLKGLEFGKVVL